MQKWQINIEADMFVKQETIIKNGQVKQFFILAKIERLIKIYNYTIINMYYNIYSN